MDVTPVLARAALDRADYLRGDPDALDRAWTSGLLLTVDGRGRFPVQPDQPGNTSALALTPTEEGSTPRGVLLGVVAGQAVFAERVAEVAAPASDLRVARLSPTDSALAATALGMLNWHDTTQFSPVDGAPTTAANGGWHRVNNRSGKLEFPRTDAAIICVLHDGVPGPDGRVLLGRQAVWPERRLSLFAGFVEPGESLEQCVQREMAEEVGLTVGAPRYVASQPWPFPRSIMVGFEAIADPAQPLAFNDGEIVEAHWFTRAQVQRALAAGDWGTDAPDEPLLLPSSISIARGMLEAWAAR